MGVRSQNGGRVGAHQTADFFGRGRLSPPGSCIRNKIIGQAAGGVKLTAEGRPREERVSKGKETVGFGPRRGLPIGRRTHSGLRRADWPREAAAVFLAILAPLRETTLGLAMFSDTRNRQMEVVPEISNIFG